jgi:transposase-like protein
MTETEGAVIRTDRRGRMLVSAEQREALLDEFERSGMSGMAFCKLHGLVYPTFASWRKKRRERPESGAPAFAEVVVGEEAGRHVEPGGALSVTLSCGAVIEVSGRGQLPLLAELLTALSRHRSC